MYEADMDTHQAADYYRKRLSEITKDKLPLFLTGILVVFAFITYSTIAIYKNNYNIFKAKTQDQILSVDAKTEEIERMIKIKKIDLITPTAKITNGDALSSLQTDSPVPTVKVVGQISSISSGQVTYSGNTYIVQEGDTLGIIANKVYGDADAWMTIADANGIDDPSSLYVGQELVIPR